MSATRSQLSHAEQDFDDELIPSLNIPAGSHGNNNPAGKRQSNKLKLKILLGLITGVTTVCIAGFIYNQLSTRTNGAAVIAFNASRDYNQSPFDLLDAQQICQFQSKEVHGDTLIMSYLDTHSTRFEEKGGIYKIFLVAHIGSRSNYSEANIHCYIDPELHLISHYKTFYPEQVSIMQRALKFFSK